MLSYILIVFSAMAGGSMMNSLEVVRATFDEKKGRAFETEKTVTGVLGTKTYKGRFTIRKGKIHWMTSTPKRQLLLYDGKSFFSVRYPNSPSQKTEVVKTSAKNKKNSVFSIFNAKKPLKELFKIKRVDSGKKKHRYQMIPKLKEISIDKFFVLVDPVAKQISKIEYEDDIGGKTVIQFGPVEIVDSLSEGFFAYTPPEGTKVFEQ